ncbi:MAG: YdbL family protein [Zoogloeaceae bacterium]|jgi:uncharacterized protein YdbL (DUF1318 family)|nr:YdbL family protein [Zoogloeaceae bacterium]
MKKFLLLFAVLFSLVAPAGAQEEAAPDLRIDTPAAKEIRASLKARFAQIKPLLENGTLGVTADGKLAVRDPASVPLAERQNITRLISGDASDKAALYREIARANGHPEWEQQIADTIHERMNKRIPAGWWIQDANGKWTRRQEGGAP